MKTRTLKLALAAAAVLTQALTPASADDGRRYNWIEAKTYTDSLGSHFSDITYYNGLGLSSQTLNIGAHGPCKYIRRRQWRS